MSDYTFLCNGQARQYQNWLHMAGVVRPRKWFKNVVRQLISLDALIFLFVLTNAHQISTSNTTTTNYDY